MARKKKRNRKRLRNNPYAGEIAAPEYPVGECDSDEFIQDSPRSERLLPTWVGIDQRDTYLNSASTWQPHGGNELCESSAKSCASIPAPQPARLGQVFTAWHRPAEPAELEESVTADNEEVMVAR